MAKQQDNDFQQRVWSVGINSDNRQFIFISIFMDFYNAYCFPNINSEFFNFI